MFNICIFLALEHENFENFIVVLGKKIPSYWKILLLFKGEKSQILRKFYGCSRGKITKILDFLS